MASLFKKIFVFLPVGLLGFLYFYDHTAWFRQVNGKRLLFLGLTLALLYGWILLEIFSRKQRNFLQIGIQSGFYVYVFMVLTLTGYFILFREISAVDWWDKLLLRIERRDHVNFELFEIFRIYKLSDTQIIGNFLMLLPLGIFLPLLYKRTSSFFIVLLTCLFISCFIEFLQLITSYRSADIDDVMLNTLGAGFGFLLYSIARSIGSFARSRFPQAAI
jgi:glycopeptide antibiotics resistance protein